MIFVLVDEISGCNTQDKDNNNVDSFLSHYCVC